MIKGSSNEVKASTALSNDERLSKADDIIHNDQGNNLETQVEALHQHYLTISA